MAWADGTEEISNSADLIDSREVIARIAHLAEVVSDASRCKCGRECATPDELTEHLSVSNTSHGATSFDDVTEDIEELAKLRALAEEASGHAPDWEYGETLIRDSYFQTYAQELAEDIGAVNGDASWPNNHIDWEAAAEALLIDYSEVEFDGVTYYIR